MKKQAIFRDNTSQFREVRKDIGEVKDEISRFREDTRNTYRIKGINRRLQGLQLRILRAEDRQQARESALKRRRERVEKEGVLVVSGEWWKWSKVTVEYRRGGQVEEVRQGAVGEHQGDSGVLVCEANELIEYLNRVQRLRAKQSLTLDREKFQTVEEEVKRAWEELKEKFIKRIVEEQATEDYKSLVDIVNASCIRLLRRQEEWRAVIEGVQRHSPVTPLELETVLGLHRRIERVERQQERYLRFGTPLKGLDSEILTVSARVKRLFVGQGERSGVSWGYQKLIDIVQRRLQQLVLRQQQFWAELSEENIGNGGEYKIKVHVTTSRNLSSF